MPQERDEITIGDVPLDPALIRKEKKARLASVLERGMIGDRLAVPLPSELVGQWCPNNKLDIYRMQGLGFEIDTVHAKNRSLHDGGDGAAVVGDVIFMTTPKENYELIQEVNKELMDAAHNPRKQKEDSETTSLIDKIGMPTVNTSRTDSVSSRQIAATLTQGQGG